MVSRLHGNVLKVNSWYLSQEEVIYTGAMMLLTSSVAHRKQ